MPFHKYRPFPPVALPERKWPDKVIERAPRWCSVDLRDGNQTLIEPMDIDGKLQMYELLLEVGFAEIEVGFPTASQPDFEFIRRLVDEDRIPEDVTIQVISLHAHNDCGTGVAATELALMAGAERVEGTLFGNGERTGNCDIVTLAMNLFSQGVDPELDIGDIPRIRRTAEALTRLPIHARHPYAGDLVFTAVSGSHQDAAIRKGMAKVGRDRWEVPYLPIDPRDVGSSYQETSTRSGVSSRGQG